MRAFLRVAERKGIANSVQLVALAIRSAPNLAVTPAKLAGLGDAFTGTLLDPVMTLDRVRSQLAERSVAELAAFLRAKGGVLERRLQLDREYALGWMLSPQTRAQIDARREIVLNQVSPTIEAWLAGASP
jgi:hypothetical protein